MEESGSVRAATARVSPGGVARRPKAVAGPVPVFSLYGEAGVAPDLEFVHIEDIRSRSERYAWEISPHLHKGLFQALFVLAGRAEASLDGSSVRAGPGSVIVVPPGVVHAFRFEPQTLGYVLTLAEALPLRLADARGRAIFEALAAQPGVIALGDEIGRAQALLDQIAIEARSFESGHGLVCEWLVAAVLMLVARHNARRASGLAPDDRGSVLFARFRSMVEDHFRDHWPVSRYAEALSVSETRLDRLCRTLAGRSAFEMVQERLALESRRKLVHVAAPISLIAYELGFEDPAYFCRFFRKRTGLTPSAFRRLQRGRLADIAVDATIGPLS